MFREFSWTGPGPLVLAFLVWMKFCEVLFRFFLEFGWGALKDAGLKLLQSLDPFPSQPPPPPQVINWLASPPASVSHPPLLLIYYRK